MVKIEVYKVWDEYTDPAGASNISAKGHRDAIRLFLKTKYGKQLREGFKGKIININVREYLGRDVKTYEVWIGERGGIYRIEKLIYF